MSLLDEEFSQLDGDITSSDESDDESYDDGPEHQPFCRFCKPGDFTYGNQSCDMCSFDAEYAIMEAHPHWFDDDRRIFE